MVFYSKNTAAYLADILWAGQVNQVEFPDLHQLLALGAVLLHVHHDGEHGVRAAAGDGVDGKRTYSWLGVSEIWVGRWWKVRHKLCWTHKWVIRKITMEDKRTHFSMTLYAPNIYNNRNIFSASPTTTTISSSSFVYPYPTHVESLSNTAEWVALANCIRKLTWLVCFAVFCML